MPDSTGLASTGATLELIHSQGTQSRRLRPPDPNNGGGRERDRVPLRAENDKLHRRESRLGLRNLFGRHKTTSDADHAPTPIAVPPPRELSQRAGGIRASLAGISNWPYGLHGGSNHGRRSESVLPSFTPSTCANPGPIKSPPTLVPDLRHKKSASVVRNAKGPLATWDPPPLFQAYPQAIKHAYLPACTASAEAVLRLHHNKGSLSLRDGLNQSLLALGASEEHNGEKGDKVKKRHRRNTSASSLKLEWTTKIFVLVTSGYLLQYTGDGSFDRLPEKILQLGKDSAAFASDVIPGRHWVLRVSSTADSEGVTSSVANPFLSRLAFRSLEKRQTAEVLMVFESAEEMDGWIATLRREIEALGGKKNLSETGKPKADEYTQHLKNQTSQRTLVVRDPDRFSRVISREISWDHPPAMSSPDIHLELAESRSIREQSFDDTSTASGVSHDGRQLDGLRDSTHRLSYMSSGQRTVVTSAGSSPACSPIRDSFASHNEDFSVSELSLLDEQTQPQPRLRPNAAAINDRRQSLQTANHLGLADMRAASAQNLRPLSTCTGSWNSDTNSPVTAAPLTIPNFSVPQGVSKRYSLTRPAGSLGSLPLEPAAVPFSYPPIPGRSSTRRPPPTALAINSRPLSFVEDQPSPLSPSSQQFGSELDGNTTTAPDTPSIFSPFEHQADERQWETEANPATHSTDHYVHVQVRPGSERSMDNESMRAVTINTDGRRGSHTIIIPNAVFVASEPDAIPQFVPRDRPRAKSSLDDFARSLSPGPAPSASAHALRHRRLSLFAQSVERPHFDTNDLPPRSRTPSLKPVPRSSQHLRTDSFSKALLLQRRSMSQLAEGPPPAPPPSRALPPIPRKASTARFGSGN